MIFRVQAAVENCRIFRLCCAFTSKHVAKYGKETCQTVHSIPKETCDKVTRFKQQKINCVCLVGKPERDSMRMSAI